MFRNIIFLLLIQNVMFIKASWDDWWTYDGISGPDFWGLLNPEWNLCNKGRRQSPINIIPDQLIYDPNLRSINIDKHKLNGIIENNGHSIVFKVDNHQNSLLQSQIARNDPINIDQNQQQITSAALSSSNLDSQIKNLDFFSATLGQQNENTLLMNSLQHGLTNSLQFNPSISDNSLNGLNFNNLDTNQLSNDNLNLQSQQTLNNLLNIWDGPLSYIYTLDSIYLHFGRTDNTGSEHLISGYQFPAEIQIIAYNSDLYQNISEASYKTNGLVAISLLLQLGNNTNSELEAFVNKAQNIKHRGENVTIKSFSLFNLLPDLTSYLTYEGSLTIPGCYETVTWIVINKPVFITKKQLFVLRKLMQGESESPKAPLGNNFRPVQPLNHRPIRTNIDFKRMSYSECPTMKRNMHYQTKDFLP